MKDPLLACKESETKYELLIFIKKKRKKTHEILPPDANKFKSKARLQKDNPNNYSFANNVHLRY